MAGTLNSKVAVVTGGASGIGRSCALRLARDGAKVAVLDLNEGDAKQVVAEIEADGGTAHALAVDVADRASVDQALAQTREHLGPVTILVNSAGKTGYHRFIDMSLESWTSILTVNLTGTFHCCQSALPDMIEAGWGRIVNISSSSAQGGQPYMAHYVASKAGVIGFTKALALELGPSGITVNTIPPGFVDTPMLRLSEQKGRFGATVDEHAARTPVRRVGRPEDISAACAFLVSEEAGYITGQIIGVNGGRNT
ncbi:NAD(P)-dependent dehydrogenase, short-chain alcohol dehydrogenase family [Parafrankia irregularis]|uniref:NAD(P)-dependent dehydrogenase, short-chain alcohol dehydrogenase family n=1 Tax=Parafrankia irregularis TaxID=795642 RepID=A0A0S4QFW0_9ACTN|nr:MULTISPECIES: SDR family NAD(P)-dependent oxidoreductase [Parafrankia]MBE3202955.1 SDR family oxidoreductase [Parafrankia sp. CH37]CUU54416.1 NAD(P)-dependent dehydrogenase, short-chain alcohol dehydrogenase family [Parafrankia irregularis]